MHVFRTFIRAGLALSPRLVGGAPAFSRTVHRSGSAQGAVCWAYRAGQWDVTLSLIPKAVEALEKWELEKQEG